jgi:hypothetical protein
VRPASAFILFFAAFLLPVLPVHAQTEKDRVAALVAWARSVPTPDPGPPVNADTEVTRIFGSAAYHPWCDAVRVGVDVVVEKMDEDGASYVFDATARELIRRGLPKAWQWARSEACRQKLGRADPNNVFMIRVKLDSVLGGTYDALNYQRAENSNIYQWREFTSTVASYQSTARWFKRIVTIIFVTIVVSVCLYNWRVFPRWYYFYFYPHPARSRVEQALNTRTVLDGPALAAAIGEVPSGNSIFRKVRLEQGEALVGRMQHMSRSIEAELQRAAAARARADARQYERQAAEGYETAALHAIQEAIALAAVALERAKAAWQTSEAIRKRRTA